MSEKENMANVTKHNLNKTKALYFFLFWQSRHWFIKLNNQACLIGHVVVIYTNETNVRKCYSKSNLCCSCVSQRPVEQFQSEQPARSVPRVHPGGLWLWGASGVSNALQQPGRESAEEAGGRSHHRPHAPQTLQRTKPCSAIWCRQEPHHALPGRGIWLRKNAVEFHEKETTCCTFADVSVSEQA